MGLEIDIEDFLAQLTATKPPYTCPFETCNKTYKSYPGIAQHMKSHEPVNPDSAATGDGKKKGASSGRNRSPSGSEYGSSTAREALTYAEAQRMIEVEIDGRTHRINICESLDIIKEDKNAKMNGLIADESDKTIGVSDSVEAEVKGTKGKSGAKNGFQGRSSKSGKKGKGKSTKTMAKVKAKSMASPEKPKLPEASFRKVDNPIEVPEALPRPAAYYRYTEKPIEELDESVEYDMDEEDCAWLDIINKDRRSKKLPEVPADTFELLMDRLEKESYFLSKDSKDHLAPAIDEDAVCCICNDGDCQNSNAILFCDMCDLAVHQECYGVPYIPEGQWLCRRCLNSPSAGVDCVLCPNKGGAFKQTDKSEWAHVVCAIWIPEVCFANTVFLEPIDSIDNIPQARWRLNCYICKQKGIGACIQCHKPNCYTAFHVTCAQSAGIFMHIDVDKNRNGVQSIRKAAYCHVHTPADETAGTQIALSGVYSTREEDFSRSTVKTKNKKSSKIPLADRILAATETEFTEKIKKARKILAEKRSAPTQVSIPTIPPERLTAIVEKMTLPKRNQFIQRLLGYWTLKRQSRNGVPLLRRLQISYSGSRRAPGEAVEVDSEAVKKQKEEHKSMQRLRQDLERARLLVELIRKREKTKRHVMELLQAVTESHLQPFKLFLRQIVKQLSQKDTNRFFQNPVSVADAPDYFEYISEPMDFSAMASKVEKCEYESLEALEGDFNLMIDNCKSYNDPETIYFKAANKLKDLCRPIFRDAKSMIQTIGFNEKAGIHDPPVSMTEIPLSLGTQTVNDTTSSEMVSPNSAEQALKKRHDTLTAVLEKTMEMKSGGSRTVKIRDYRDEIAEIERSLHVLNPSLYPAPPTDPRTSPSSKRKESPDKSSCTPNKKVKTTPLPPPSTSKSPRTPKRDVISDSEATDIYSPSPKKSMKKLKASNQHGTSSCNLSWQPTRTMHVFLRFDTS